MCDSPTARQNEELTVRYPLAEFSQKVDFAFAERPDLRFELDLVGQLGGGDHTACGAATPAYGHAGLRLRHRAAKCLKLPDGTRYDNDHMKMEFDA